MRKSEKNENQQKKSKKRRTGELSQEELMLLSDAVETEYTWNDLVGTL